MHAFDLAARGSIADRAEGPPRTRGFAPPGGLRGLGAEGPVVLVGDGLGDERRRQPALDGLARDDALLHVAPRGQLELHVEQDLLDDRPQAAGAGLALERLVGDGLERLVGEHELDPVEREEALELLGERVPRLGEDLQQIGLRELVHRAHYRQAADELGDQPVLDEVLGQALLEELGGVLLLAGLDRGGEADALVADALLDDLVEVRERAAADEEDVRGVDRQELLVRMLAPALRRHRRGRPLEDLQERLLDALAGHVARDRRVVRLAGDLVDLVDVDDPGLGLLDVVVGRLDELQQDVFDVLADVAGLGQRRGVGDREGDVEDLRERLREERLAAARRAEQKDVRLLELDVRLVRAEHLHALVVVVDGDGQGALRRLLSDDVLTEDVVDLPRLGEVVDVERRRGGELLVDDLVAEIDALVADVNAGPGDQLLDLALRLPAEGAEELLVGVGRPGHGSVKSVLLDDPVDDPVLLGLLRGHEVVALGVLGDLLDRLARVLGDDLVELLAQLDDLAGVDLNVGGLALETRGDLVDQDLRVGQRHALALRAAGQEQRAHRHRDADADRLHVGLDELHRVVDREARVHRPAGRVDVDRDVLVGVLRLEVQQLRHDEVRDLVVHRRAEEDDPLVEQTGVDVERALAARRLLNDHRYEWAHGPRFGSAGGGGILPTGLSSVSTGRGPSAGLASPFGGLRTGSPELARSGLGGRLVGVLPGLLGRQLDRLRLLRQELGRAEVGEVLLEGVEAVRGLQLLEQLLRRDALLLRGILEFLEDLVLGRLDLLRLDDGGEHGLAPERLLGLGHRLVDDLVLGPPGHLQVHLLGDPLPRELAHRLVPQLVRAGVRERLGDLDLGLLGHGVDDGLAELAGDRVPVAVGEPGTDVVLELVERVEAGAVHGEMVVDGRERLLLDLLDLHGEDGLLPRQVLGLVVVGERHADLVILARAGARELLLEAGDEAARPELDELVGALAAGEGLTVDRAVVVHDDEVALRGGAVGRVELGEALAELLDLGVDRLVGDLGLAAADLDALVGAERGRRAHPDLDREDQGLALAGQGRHVDLGVTHRDDARGVDRVGVPAPERLAHGLVEDGVAADAPDDHRRGHLAPAEARHAELAAEGARGLLDALLHLGGGDLRLDAHARLGKLGDGGLDVVRHERGTIASGPCSLRASGPGSTPARWAISPRG